VTGYIGSLCILYGLYLIGQKRELGFLFGVLGELFWLHRGYMTGLLDLMALSVLFAAVHLRNWYKWTGDYGKTNYSVSSRRRHDRR
jgi:hypothetical protein